MEWYRPGAVILQCGADSLAEDKLGVFNLSMQGTSRLLGEYSSLDAGHADCVSFVKSFNLPLIVLGGGGYTIRNVARAWAYETGVLVGAEMDEQLPYNDYMEYYGPEFKLSVPRNNMENNNSREYLEKTTWVYHRHGGLQLTPSQRSRARGTEKYAFCAVSADAARPLRPRRRRGRLGL